MPERSHPNRSGLRSQVSGLGSRVSGLGSQVSGLKSQVSSLKSQGFRFELAVDTAHCENTKPET